MEHGSKIVQVNAWVSLAGMYIAWTELPISRSETCETIQWATLEHPPEYLRLWLCAMSTKGIPRVVHTLLPLLPSLLGFLYQSLEQTMRNRRQELDWIGCLIILFIACLPGYQKHPETIMKGVKRKRLLSFKAFLSCRTAFSHWIAVPRSIARQSAFTWM